MRLARAVNERFETHDYPTTTHALADAHGDIELPLPRGDVTLREVLEQLPDEAVESAEEARLLTYSAFGEAAIGRKGYSDREGTCIGERGNDQVSL